MKVMISQPMNNRNQEEIKKEKGDFDEQKSKIQTVLLYKIEALQDLLN